MASYMTQAARTTTMNAAGMVEYVVSHFLPGLQPLIQRYPKLIRMLSVLLALWYCAPISSIQSLWSRFSRFLIATVEVSVDEDLFHYLTAWIADQKTLRPNKTLYASSTRVGEVPKRRPGDANPNGIVQKVLDDQVKYEQSQGLQIFVHNKRVFFLRRASVEGQTVYANRMRRSEILSISCFGRSLFPIQSLVDEIYRLNREKEKSMTIIRRPYSAANVRTGCNWSRLTSKFPRHLDTVILDPVQKAAVLDDITEYMTDNTRTFYADHGIPYRRGYLFHGPPGTGKTSFCLALAAHFHLEVYVLTLLDQNIQDSHLMTLMNQLPSPSILLLEDIDSAGFSDRKSYTTNTNDGVIQPGNHSADDQSQNLQNPDVGDGVDEPDPNKPSTKVSLSGLLNAIDGVAAPEGHILVMTTNRPYELDDAIARAGRVSVTVAFTNATKKQAEELFLRMYVDEVSTVTSDSTSRSKNKSEKIDTISANVNQLAKKFMEQIPDLEFTPADLQDYLLVHKRDPQRAVDKVEKWVNDKQAEQKKRMDSRQAARRLRVGRRAQDPS